jgi:hypothetical protein
VIDGTEYSRPLIPLDFSSPKQRKRLQPGNKSQFREQSENNKRLYGSCQPLVLKKSKRSPVPIEMLRTVEVGRSVLISDLCFQMIESQGAGTLSVLSTCVTKQTRDMRYSEVEPRWFLGSRRTHDDAVCPRKRAVLWINACNFCRATKREEMSVSDLCREFACRGQRATDGSTAMKKSDRRVSQT